MRSSPRRLCTSSRKKALTSGASVSAKGGRQDREGAARGARGLRRGSPRPARPRARGRGSSEDTPGNPAPGRRERGRPTRGDGSSLVRAVGGVSGTSGSGQAPEAREARRSRPRPDGASQRGGRAALGLPIRGAVQRKSGRGPSLGSGLFWVRPAVCPGRGWAFCTDQDPPFGRCPRLRLGIGFAGSVRRI